MTIWYRASQSNDIDRVFSGEGGLYTSARWNYQGRKVIYCSESISLCTLEWLSHNGLTVSAFTYYRYSIEVPDNLIKEYKIKDLPDEWNVTPATDITRDFADENLFKTNNYLALALPSVVVPEEYNLIINPLHSDFAKLIKNVIPLGKHSAPSRNLD